MRLVAEGYKWDGRGSLQARVTLLAEDSTPLFEDSISLSKQASRHRFAQTLLKRFPQLKGKDIESQLLQLLWQAKDQQQEAEEEIARKQGERRVSQADKLVKLVEENDVELFHTPTGVAYARIGIEGHFEIHRCRSQGFKQWLSRQLYLSEGKTPNSDALNSAIITIEGRAIFDGKTRVLHNRGAFHEGAIFYDLADEEWRAIKITPEGWQTIDNPPILFCRYQHQKPQVEPQHGGDPWRLLDFVNLRDASQQLLFMVYVEARFIPDIPHPIIHPHGEQGSAKTTLLRLVGSLVDPSSEELLMFARDVNELAQKLYHHWVCYFDNLTSLPDWISDVLSRAVTGIGFGKRELFTDEGDVIFQLKRVIGLNGINVVATKPDLLDRCILLELKRISDNECRREKELLAEFEQVKPQILGGFFDILSKAMGMYPTLQLKALPRMADFAHWGGAIAQALGYSVDDFIDAYKANIQSQNIEVLSSNPIAAVLLGFMENRDSYEGTPAELLDELGQEAEQMKIKTTVKSWPGAPQVLTRRLNELKSNLRQGGIEVDTTSGARIEGKWKRLVKVSRTETVPTPKGMQNTVDTVAPLQSDTEPYLRECNGIDSNIVADGEIPLQNQPECNAIGQSATIARKIPLQSSLSEESSRQLGPQQSNDSYDKLHTLWAEDESAILQSLGMTKEQAIAIWDKQGRPVIHLGPGENCYDLTKLLAQRDIKLEHLSAIKEWLEKHQGWCL